MKFSMSAKMIRSGAELETPGLQHLEVVRFPVTGTIGIRLGRSESPNKKTETVTVIDDQLPQDRSRSVRPSPWQPSKLRTRMVCLLFPDERDLSLHSQEHRGCRQSTSGHARLWSSPQKRLCCIDRLIRKTLSDTELASLGCRGILLKQWEIRPVGGHSRNGWREESFRSVKFSMSAKMIYRALSWKRQSVDVQ